MTTSQAENLPMPKPDFFDNLTSTEQENLRLVMEWLQAWSSVDSDRIIRVMTPDAVFHEQLFRNL